MQTHEGMPAIRMSNEPVSAIDGYACFEISAVVDVDVLV